MTPSQIPYDAMVESALRDVVRQALEYAADHGLDGSHHFYITFRTDHPAGDFADYLIERYPEEMTIVLQHQFFGLEILEQGFRVTLSFDNVPEELYVPFGAITVFADPSVNFALQFHPDFEEAAEGGGGGPQAPDELTMAEDMEERKLKKGGQVVSLDAWRRR